MPSRPDMLAKVLLDRGSLRVDPVEGAVFKASGDRAEVLDRRLAYGRVVVYQKPLTWAMAHRVVWISVYGLIPDGLQINHKNRLRWDNRLANLELVSASGNMRHWRGRAYDRISTDQGAVDPGWLNVLDHGVPLVRDEYGKLAGLTDHPDGHVFI